MSSEPSLTANRRNAQRSTGPRTAAGKAVAKLNAVSHGLRSAAPVVPGERAKDWHDHKAGMLAALAPVGTLETELADRAALLLWRLRRVATFETNVSAAGVESVVATARAAEVEPTPNPLLFDPPRTLTTIRKELPAPTARPGRSHENAPMSTTAWSALADRFRALAGEQEFCFRTYPSDSRQPFLDDEGGSDSCTRSETLRAHSSTTAS